jgi:hypothetical protein
MNISSSRKQRAILLLILSAGLLASGCSGKTRDAEETGTVSGTLTLDDQPFSDGTVNFYNAKDGTSGKGVLLDGGRFTIEDPLPVGSYTVTVLPPEMTAPQIGVKVTVAKAAIPDKYRSDRTTDLKVDVKKGENTVKLNMVKGK